MATTIPIEHPSLVLGGVVDKTILQLVSNIVGNQSRIESAQQKLSSYLVMKRSLAMMVNELLDMGIDTSEVRPRLDEVDEAIKRTGSEYISTRLGAEEAMQKAREELSTHANVELTESPIDYGASQLRHLPLSSDSLKLDAQYFSCIDESEEDHAANIERYVRDSVGGIGSRAPDLAKEAGAQVARQVKNNSLTGTLVITANCDHRNIAVFDPLVIDPGKAAAAWNRIFPGNALPGDERTLMQMATAAEANAAEDSIAFISGVTYGSSFVGMVHFLKTSSVRTGVDEELAAQIREKLQIGGWLEHASGGFGVDRETLNEVRKILSMQNVSAHISVIVSGALPSIASNEVKFSINKISQPEPVKSLEALSAMGENNGAEADSIDSDAARSKKVSQAVKLQSARTNSLIRTLNEVDRGANRVLDVNSLLGAFENYLASIHNEGAGIPTGFYIRHIGKREIANLWLKRNFGDPVDTKPKRPQAGKKPSQTAEGRA
jgi:hypothetical protein